MDRRYLRMIADIYKGGPVGVETTLAAGLSEPRDTIEEVIEPYMIQLGLIARTARSPPQRPRLDSSRPADAVGRPGRPADPVRGQMSEGACGEYCWPWPR